MSVRVEAESGCCTIWIDRPEARNSISREVIQQLDRALDETIERHPHVLVIRGTGERAFVAGGDVKDFNAIRDLPAALAMSSSMRRVLDRLAALDCPAIAAINGAALGGGMEVAVACDLRIAVRDAVLAFNQVQLGITPAWGGIERLAQLIGPGRASWLLLTGCRMTASEATAIGLIEHAVDRTDLDATLRSVVQSMVASPREALVAIKRAIRSVTAEVPAASAAQAVQSFAECWIADRHWELADAATAQRTTTAAHG